MPDLAFPADARTVRDVAETLGRYLVFLRLIADWAGLDKAVVTLTPWDVVQGKGDVHDTVRQLEAIRS